jgi:hypothetical protein
MDDDTAAGQVNASTVTTATDFNGDLDTLDTGEATFIGTLLVTQVDYHDGEETVFMRTPTVTADQRLRWREVPRADGRQRRCETEVFLFHYDGRDNKLNSSQHAVLGPGVRQPCSTLETAATAGDDHRRFRRCRHRRWPSAPATTTSKTSIGARHKHDSPPMMARSTGAPSTEFQEENFAVHGDDYLIGGAGDRHQSPVVTGDDRVRGSLGNDVLDGGKDWYAVQGRRRQVRLSPRVPERL